MIEIRPSQALHLWRDVALAQVHDDALDPSPRQVAILLIVYLELPPHTVRGLARRLGVTKPVVTRALNAFEKAGLVERRADPSDRRNVLVGRTVEGADYVERLGRTISEHATRLS